MTMDDKIDQVLKRLEAIERNGDETRAALLGAMGRPGLIAEVADLRDRIVVQELWRTRILGGVAVLSIVWTIVIVGGGMLLKLTESPSAAPTVQVYVKPEDLLPPPQEL